MIQFSQLKERVKGRVRLVQYRAGHLHYRCSVDGYLFTVPIEDCGDATFPAEEKASLFMRWIRRAMETEAGAKPQVSSDPFDDMACRDLDIEAEARRNSDG